MVPNNLTGAISKNVSHGKTGAANPYLLAILASLMTAAAFTQLYTWLIWISFVPLLILLGSLSPKVAFKAGFCFGAGLAVFVFWWMIPGAGRFTGSRAGVGYGLIAFLLSSCLLCFYFGGIMLAARYLSLPAKFLKSGKSATNTVNIKYTRVRLARLYMPLLIRSLTLASIFTLAEYILQRVTGGLPWLYFQAGLPLSASRWMIQWVSLLGAPVLSFMVIFINSLIACTLREAAWKLLWVPVCFIGLYGLGGYLLQKEFRETSRLEIPADATTENKITIAILSENIPPDIKWDSINGNQLAARLVDLSREINNLKPRPSIALWSESAIPWTYEKDDDLVQAILQNTKTSGITHFLGINTATGQPGVVYNSIYELSWNGEVKARYDKQVLLSLIERPLGKLLLPFLSSSGFTAMRGPCGDPLPVNSQGKAGILICNESTSSALAREALLKGATFFCNPGNDGWFMDTYLSRLHFYHARLRAVETRKDIVLNSNMGYSGLIQASGKILFRQKSRDPAIYNVQVHPNHFVPFVASCPHLLLLACLLFIAGRVSYVFYRSRHL